MDYWESVADALAPQHVDHARRLVGAGRVTLIDLDEGSTRTSADAVVRDLTPQGEQVYVVSFLVELIAGSMSAYCSCERGPQCAHVCAALLSVSDADGAESDTATMGAAAGGPRAFGPAASRSVDPAPKWQRTLDKLLPSGDSQATVELCLFFAVDDGSGGRRRRGRSRKGPALAVRPGMRGARGAWIKGQTRWGRLDDLEADPEALALLRELDALDTLGGDDAYYGWGYGYAAENEWMRLDQLPSRTVWSLLADLQKVGVALVSAGKRQHPVRLDGEPLSARVALAERRKRLSVGAELVSGGESWHPDGTVLFVGEPAVALAHVSNAGTPDERVVMHPLSAPIAAPVRDLLVLRNPVSIDSAGRERFEADYLPRLQSLAPVVSPDDSYAVPIPPEAVLELSIEHGAQQVHLTWLWDRAGGVIRPDPDREAAIVESIRAAAGAHASALFREVGTASAGADAAGAVSAGADAAAGSGAVGHSNAAPPDQTLRASAAVLFVAEVLPALRDLDGLRVVENTAAPTFRAASSAPDVAVSAEPGANDWFDLTVRVTIEGEDVDFATLFRALNDDEPILVLPSGTYFPLDTPELQRLRALIAEASALSDRPADRPAVSRYQADLWEELVELGVVARQEIEWWMKVRGLSDHDQLEQIEPPASLRAELRDYQRAGFSWLHFLRTHGLGGVLADDMGLGKTLQTIAMIEKARVDGEVAAPFLIVAPTSVVGNWVAECARFAPDLTVRSISAMGKRRGTALADEIAGAHVVVTSYALFRLEFDAYKDIAWSGLILDEAQQIKNPSSQGYRCARLLDAPFTLVITGTPLENNLLELWALTSLACPGLLGGRRSFTDYYRTPIEREHDTERLRTLQRRLRPFLLRRTKDLVAAELPPKQEQELVLDLHPAHQRLYDRRLHRERQKVLGLVDDVAANRFQIFRSLTLLRQLALAPDLVEEGDAPSVKIDALVDLLVEASAEGHRALVLSQFTRFLTRARDAADRAGIRSQYLDGSTTDRPAVIDKFRTGDDPAFFVSLKAGGVGLNLVEADYVILLDPWWNPAVEAQAIDRAHRIGQTRPVIVYRLVARGTIEEKVMALKKNKAQLFARVLDADGEGGAGSARLSADDIRSLVE
ncbi:MULTISPECIES: DEAD/DEAH box helicase [Bacteria]